jgi:quinoprotein dehydrogenase-associated probable ABC transporter substrate-binding protein
MNDTPSAARFARWGTAALAAMACTLLMPASAQDAAPRTALRVCQDPNNLPFSNDQKQGIENRIADVFGKALGLPVTYYAFPQRLAFIRNTLRFKLPGQDYPCDIVMGVPAGYDQVSVTKPYYRSTYALVFSPGKGLDQVKSGQDFLSLPPDTLKSLRIGLYDRSPASQWLVKHQLVDQGVPYPIMNADPSQYPGQIIERDLVAGKLDAAIVWGPIAGYFAQRVKPTALTVVPLKSEPGVKFDFAMAMGVRYGERAWKQQVEGLIVSQQAEIQAILHEFGVPLVDESPAAR